MNCTVDKGTKWLVAGLLVFTAVVAIMLPVLNYDYLYSVQDHSLFLRGRTFMAEKMAVPGGLLDWLGCYLTQFFYFPWLGSAVVWMIWMACAVVTRLAFRLSGVWSLAALLPVVALLCSVTDLGYWLYYQKQPGFFCSQSLGYLFMVTDVWLYHVIVRRCGLVSTPYVILTTLAGYCLIGWWALLAAVVIGMGRGGAWTDRGGALLSVAAVPWGVYHLYTQVRFDDAWWMGFPLFRHADVTEWRLSMPFFAIVLTVIVFGLTRGTAVAIRRKLLGRTIATLIMAVCCVVPFWTNVYDECFHSELRMSRAMDESRWQDVVDEFARHNTAPTLQMVMMKNTALLHLGLLGERMYELGNCGRLPDSGELDVRMTVTAGPMLYYQNGLINFAYRWAVENEVERGLSVGLLKMLARCAVWNEENELAVKYITMLKSTLFHDDWARERERMIYDIGAFRQSEEYKAIAPLVVMGEDELDADNGLCVEYIIYNFAGLIARNVRQQEAAACYAMMLKDDELAKYQIATLYENCPAADVPGHIVEAVDLLNQNHSPEFQKFIADYRSAVGTGRKIVDVGKELRTRYGGTYWWYYYFYNDFKLY